MQLRVAGEITVPGDKSITHRALMLAAAANGESRLRGLLPGADCRSTAEVLRALGCGVPPLPDGGAEVRIRGRGFAAWRMPATVLDCGNSGTTARLMMGLLAGRPFCATLTGDASLRGRPMRRVTDPLAAMGAQFQGQDPDRLPLRICGGALRELQHRSPKASAQIKSAVLLAGLSGGVPVGVWEPIQSRDHTERMLRGLGVAVREGAAESGWEVALEPSVEPLPPLDFAVPGDPSSAAFLVALALLADAGELCFRNVGVNPTRTGLFRVIERMGGRVERLDERTEGGEPVADLCVRPAELRGVEVAADEVPAAIDEIPILAILAARASGETRITGAGELRAKESDRIATLVSNLRSVGLEADELPDGLVVHGNRRPLAGQVRTHGDHRIAMAFGVLAALPGSRIAIDDPTAVEVSFPDFWDTLKTAVSAQNPPTKPTKTIPQAALRPPHSAINRPDGIVIAIDGPAGSGKSSTAREAARRLGYRHLDSGALYRGLTWAALRAGIPPERWHELTGAEIDALRVRSVPQPDGFGVAVNGAELLDEIRTPEVNAHVSRMAAVPAVRAWLLGALRAAGQRGGLVADGRDIGTVVFPDAELKLFLVCSPAERARRRLQEQGSITFSVPEVEAERERLEGRDRLDSSRAVAPLLRAPDAILLDTTELPFEQQVMAVVRLAQARMPG